MDVHGQIILSPGTKCRCIKVSTKCLPGKVMLKNGECCTKCPEGYTQKGDQCCGA